MANKNTLYKTLSTIIDLINEIDTIKNIEFSETFDASSLNQYPLANLHLISGGVQSTEDTFKIQLTIGSSRDRNTDSEDFFKDNRIDNLGYNQAVIAKVLRQLDLVEGYELIEVGEIEYSNSGADIDTAKVIVELSTEGNNEC